MFGFLHLVCFGDRSRLHISPSLFVKFLSCVLFYEYITKMHFKLTVHGSALAHELHAPVVNFGSKIRGILRLKTSEGHV